MSSRLDMRGQAEAEQSSSSMRRTSGTPGHRRLPPGGRLGIVGPSGAGKTTLVGLLLRFWDAGSGTVLLDGADIRRYRAADVRRLFGVVPQRVYLFKGTLRDNLLVADGEASDDRILEACERARLGDLLSAQPAGLDTLVGEDGLKPPALGGDQCGDQLDALVNGVKNGA